MPRFRRRPLGNARPFGRVTRGVDLLEAAPDYDVASFLPTVRAQAVPYYDDGNDNDAGDLTPTVVTPDDARHALTENDMQYDRANAAIFNSAAVGLDFKESWGLQLGGWKAFYASTMAGSGLGWLNTKAVMEQNDRYAQQLVDWVKGFKALGGVMPGPMPPQPGQGIAGTVEPQTVLVIVAILAALAIGSKFFR